VRRLALYSAQLYRRKFSRIGNGFRDSECGEETQDGDAPGGEVSSDAFVLGTIVSIPFLLGDHLTQDVPRGPFETAEAWLLARLRLVEHDWKQIKKELDDEDDVANTEEILQLVKRLRAALQLAFLPGRSGNEGTALCHDDLNG
jgi:hypothetical protein